MKFSPQKRCLPSPILTHQPNCFARISCIFLSIWIGGVVSAQSTLPLTDLSAFQSPGPSWKLAGGVTADINKEEALQTKDGFGILVNLPDKKSPGKDLYTLQQHGDADVAFDYMMAKGSNSGVYLQGRYEIQLLDSWGKTVPTSGDNGGIYERWADSRGKGQEGFEGHAPRQNASRAPGLWQHMKISFQAPRFNASGQKVENARILRVELNGVAIQENVELSGPTRGPMANDEVAQGPLRFQGDHGPVAFRHIQLTTYDKPRPELVNLKYSLYKGKYDAEPDYAKLPPEAEGVSVLLSSNVSTIANEFLIHYTGTLRVKEPGAYTFNLSTPGGKGLLKLNNQTIIPVGGGRGTGKITLPAGDIAMELLYSKFVDWAKPALGLAVAGPGIREYIISDENVTASDPVDPILIHAPVNTLLRSFVDLADGIRITHAVNVGSPQGVHYTYDAEKGMIVQVWRGDFLDATPMWHSRGDGSSRPVGMVVRFGKPVLAIGPLPDPQAAWVADTSGSNFRPKGYKLDAADQPTFTYNSFGASVSDATTVLPNGEGLHREITVQGPAEHLYLRLAAAPTIEPLADNLYLLADQTYYIRIDEAGGQKPVIREAGGQKELLLPVASKISYAILF